MSDEPGSTTLQTKPAQEQKPVLKLSRFLPYQLNHLAETVSRSFSRIYAEKYGIGIPEWRVVATLGEYKALTARDISRSTSMHKTKVSRAVAALEKRGLIVRDRNPDDQREQTLKLSPKGSRMYQDIVPDALAYSAELQDALTEEQKALLDDIFERLHKAARSLGSDGH
ncbi:MarR family winged helix-turn-helix transcriptional regulator [Roseibium salinum]|uniref:MarR family winged helix-turn-helix transcriptional regulator n=1 Tax=Roseibium salinum TaxID=1604349 RepID=A0ABT3R1U0_9HYPH|nr:MarR family winged helix-turn-helix transcriptional regulator [Roseibium sp. DSM 29163]MCX2723219.1 MarR family winged helix-turn-helix transcriptional regulator [Roseibium sp. DSM 29163]MDN3718864.1 MarR family winged helix-turn-helix transcriptional regulator [Roseibium salinum]